MPAGILAVRPICPDSLSGRSCAASPSEASMEVPPFLAGDALSGNGIVFQEISCRNRVDFAFCHRAVFYSGFCLLFAGCGVNIVFYRTVPYNGKEEKQHISEQQKGGIS